MARSSWKVTRVYGAVNGARFANVQHASGQTVSVRIRGSKDGRLLNAWGDPYPYEVTSRPKIAAMAAQQAVQEDAKRDAALRRDDYEGHLTEQGVIEQESRTVVPRSRKNKSRRQAKRTSRGRTRGNPNTTAFRLVRIGGFVDQIKYQDFNDKRHYKHDGEEANTVMYLAEHHSYGRCLVIVNADAKPLWEDA